MKRLVHRHFSSASRFNHRRYEQAVAEARERPEEFWRRQAELVDWRKAPSKILPAHSLGSWFADGELNTAHQAIDRHVLQGRGGNEAIIFESLVTGVERHLTYSNLMDETTRMGHVFRRFGVEAGDTVLIYAPQLPESLIAMLSAARIGAPHCVVFAGFAPHQLAARIEHTRPKVIFTVDYSLEGARRIDLVPLVKEALNIVKERPRVICYHRDGTASSPFEDLAHEMNRVADLGPLAPLVVPSTHPLYYLHTSGTTGDPKALVRQHGAHAVGLMYSGRDVYGLHGPGDRMAAFSDIGWVVGHSWSVYGPLLTGSTALVVEGKPVGCPDHLAWFRLLEKHRISTTFCAPTALRAIREAAGNDVDQFRAFNLLNLRCWFVAGEKCDSSTFAWLEKILAGIPVADNWWQTETGWPITSRAFLGSYGIAPLVEGSSGLPVPGYSVSLSPEQDILIRLPLPPGASVELLGQKTGFRDKYCIDHPEFYSSGDAGLIAESGDVTISGRTDDVLNVSGHRLTTAQLEEAIAILDGVIEAAVVGVKDKIKGTIPVAFVVGKNFTDQDVVQSVRKNVGAVANLKRVYRVPKLPKTRSGKLMRNVLREFAEQRMPVQAPPTIEDPSVLAAIEDAVKSHPDHH